ncbi:homoserine O-acetyltransferase/O-succinyltransferase family protein [Helicobacter sp. T3_23-1059]
MPIIIPKDIPAFSELQKRAFIMDTARARHQDIRALEILIINLMPTKIQTENQLLSLLANSPLQINITLLTTKSYVGKNTPKSHLDKFYVHFDSIKDKSFDGAILTGAPIEHLEFEEVEYWRELVEIMQYLRAHCTSTLYLCWGAMAGLYHFYGIQKLALEKKLFGVFSHEIKHNDVLLTGLGDSVKMPHSRHSTMNPAHIYAQCKCSKLKILLEGKKSGITALKDSKDIFVLGHPEYDKDTLNTEYERDKEKKLPIKKPQNYFDKHGKIDFSWRADSSVMFSNWLNFCVYQDTPFVLAK